MANYLLGKYRNIAPACASSSPSSAEAPEQRPFTGSVTQATPVRQDAQVYRGASWSARQRQIHMEQAKHFAGMWTRVPAAIPNTEHNHWQVIKEAFMRYVSG